MQIVKFFILSLIFLSASLIGQLFSKKYVYRLEELEEMKNALNTFKTKIKFTYSPIPEIFEDISNSSNKNISKIFKLANEKMKDKTAEISWIEAVDETNTNLKPDDKHVISMLSKLLGQTDVDGQVSQIEITQNFLENQIKEAQEEKQKNQKLYNKLGMTIGLVIVIILI